MAKAKVAFVPEVRKQLSYDRKAAGVRIMFEGPGRTLQSQKDDSDINVIMKRFGATGLLPTNIRVPLKSDFGNMDFMTAMNAIVQAKRSFDALDADTRYRFHNDPQKFIDFCQDPKNLAEMRKMGLAVPEKKVVPAEPIRVIMAAAPIPEPVKAG